MTEVNPLVSFVVFSYNQERYIEEAVESAFSQIYNNLEILITDDCSTDGTFSIIEKCVSRYCGPHKLIVNRNQSNVGLAESINRAWGMTGGEIIIVQGGDDISLPERTDELVVMWKSTSTPPDLIYSNVIFINSKSEIIGRQTDACLIPTLEEVMQGQFFIAGGMAAAYSRQLISSSKFLDPRVIYEDYVLTFRALVGNGVAQIAKPLVKYRKHDESIMAKVQWGAHDRQIAQRKARHYPFEIEDRLKAWLNSGRSNPIFTWRLVRQLANARIDARSCTVSRIESLWCCFLALVFFKMGTSWRLLVRDVLRM